jgi:hypothetical protein
LKSCDVTGLSPRGHRQLMSVLASSPDGAGVALLKESATDTEDASDLATCRLALQTNSSTFGTLLSSQGSSALPARSRDLAVRQPDETYPVADGQSNRPGPAERPPRHHRPGQAGALEAHRAPGG